MSISRRDLFKTAGAAAAVAAVPALPFMGNASALPTLYGDMIHDDAPALNALIRGKPVRNLSSAIVRMPERVVHGGRFLLKAPLDARNGGWINFSQSYFQMAEDFDGRGHDRG